MTGSYTERIILNGFLAPPTETTTTNSKCPRSVSFPGSGQSARSSLSRITVVEDNAQIATPKGLEDSDSITPSSYSCLDHLVAMIRMIFCMPVSKKMKTKSVGSPQETSYNIDSSPWVLPVLVLSSRIDTDKLPVPKRAKCTIDTGNMQGNIVSREFVEEVLKYSNLLPLTAEEKEGGFGVTGHKLVPEGAIYLTWYHSKSTRVFHNMRFLVSPYSQCDLIIGARSIQKDNLLGVPNLMTTTTSKVATTQDLSMDKEEEELHKIFLKLEKTVESKEVMLLATGEDVDNNEDLRNCRDACNVADIHYQIRKAEVANDQKTVADLKRALENLPGYKNNVVPSISETTSSGIAKPNVAMPTQHKVKTTDETF